MESTTVAPDLQAWARKAYEDETVWTREASTAGRRAWHEGAAAAFALAAGDETTAAAALTRIVTDYTGVRRVQGLRGYELGVAMTRGAVGLVRYRESLTADAWATDADGQAAADGA